MNSTSASFLLGSAVTWVLVFAIYRNRVCWPSARHAHRARLQFREDLTAGADRRYRRELAARANVARAGAWVVPLETVFVEPFLQARVPEPNPYGPPDTATDWVGWAWPKVRRILPGGPGRRLRVTRCSARRMRPRRAGRGATLLLSSLVVPRGDARESFSKSPAAVGALVDMLMARMGTTGAGADRRRGQPARSAAALPGLARRRLNDGRCPVLLDGPDELLPVESQVARRG
jgi:hypothetical protein